MSILIIIKNLVKFDDFKNLEFFFFSSLISLIIYKFIKRLTKELVE